MIDRRRRNAAIAAVVLVAALIHRAAGFTEPDGPPPQPEPTAATAADRTDTAPAPEPRDRPALPDTPDPEPDGDADVEEAQRVAAAFAVAYLTGDDGERPDERAERVAPYADDDLTEAIADVRHAEHNGEPWTHEVEVVHYHPLTARGQLVSVSVATVVTADEGGEVREIPTNLTVALRPDGTGGWHVTEIL